MSPPEEEAQTQDTTARGSYRPGRERSPMKKVVRYCCDVCGQEFHEKNSCLAHEDMHVEPDGLRFPPGTLLISSMWDWPGEVKEPGQWDTRRHDWTYKCDLVGEDMQYLSDGRGMLFQGNTVTRAIPYEAVKAAFDKAADSAKAVCLTIGEKAQTFLDPETCNTYMQIIYEAAPVFDIDAE